MTTDPIRAHFEAHAATWDEHAPPDLDGRLQRLLTPFADTLHTARLVLELGTGTGACLPHLRCFAPHARLVALDLAHAMLLCAVERTAAARLAQADAQDLPFPTGNARDGFDLVVCHNSFPHFQDKPRALREVWRVLRPGGRLLILHHLSREDVNAVHQRIGAPVTHDILPTGAEMQQLFAQSGYVDVWVQDVPVSYTAHALKPR